MKLTINGVTMTFNDHSTAQILNGKVIVNGKDQPEFGVLSGVVEIRIAEGTLLNLSTDANVTASNIQGSVQAGGNVDCENVAGNVNAGGMINCDTIKGDAKAGGSINCDDIGGNATASIIKRG